MLTHKARTHSISPGNMDATSASPAHISTHTQIGCLSHDSTTSSVSSVEQNSDESGDNNAAPGICRVCSPDASIAAAANCPILKRDNIAVHGKCRQIRQEQKKQDCMPFLLQTFTNKQWTHTHTPLLHLSHCTPALHKTTIKRGTTYRTALRCPTADPT